MFVAIPLEQGIRTQLDNFVKNVQCAPDGIKWVGVENYHLTIKFLGEVPSEKAVVVKEKLGELSSRFKKFTSSILGMGAFPSLDRPVVIWAGVSEGNERVIEIAQSVDDALEPLGFKREERAFHPHVTLGRVRRGFPVSKTGFSLSETDKTKFFGTQEVQQFQLIQSQLQSTGPVYQVYESFSLGGSLAL